MSQAPAQPQNILVEMEDCELSFLDLQKRKLELDHPVLAGDSIDAQELKEKIEQKKVVHKEATKQAMKELPGKVASQLGAQAEAGRRERTDWHREGKTGTCIGQDPRQTAAGPVEQGA
eukprot:1096831-Prymnesium_polylepis.1